MRLFKSHRTVKPAPGASLRGDAEGLRQRPAGPQPAAAAAAKTAARPGEIGGPDGPEPTRYGDWERRGICYDF